MRTLQKYVVLNEVFYKFLQARFLLSMLITLDELPETLLDVLNSIHFNDIKKYLSELLFSLNDENLKSYLVIKNEEELAFLNCKLDELINWQTTHCTEKISVINNNEKQLNTLCKNSYLVVIAAHACAGYHQQLSSHKNLLVNENATNKANLLNQYIDIINSIITPFFEWSRIDILESNVEDGQLKIDNWLKISKIGDVLFYYDLKEQNYYYLVKSTKDDLKSILIEPTSQFFEILNDHQISILNKKMKLRQVFKGSEYLPNFYHLHCDNEGIDHLCQHLKEVGEKFKNSSDILEQHRKPFGILAEGLVKLASFLLFIVTVPRKLLFGRFFFHLETTAEKIIDNTDWRSKYNQEGINLYHWWEKTGLNSLKKGIFFRQWRTVTEMSQFTKNDTCNDIFFAFRGLQVIYIQSSNSIKDILSGNGPISLMIDRVDKQIDICLSEIDRILNHYCQSSDAIENPQRLAVLKEEARKIKQKIHFQKIYEKFNLMLFNDQIDGILNEVHEYYKNQIDSLLQNGSYDSKEYNDIFIAHKQKIAKLISIFISKQKSLEKKQVKAYDTDLYDVRLKEHFIKMIPNLTNDENNNNDSFRNFTSEIRSKCTFPLNIDPIIFERKFTVIKSFLQDNKFQALQRQIIAQIESNSPINFEAITAFKETIKKHSEEALILNMLSSLNKNNIAFYKILMSSTEIICDKHDKQATAYQKFKNDENEVDNEKSLAQKTSDKMDSLQSIIKSTTGHENFNQLLTEHDKKISNTEQDAGFHEYFSFLNKLNGYLLEKEKQIENSTSRQSKKFSSSDDNNSKVNHKDQKNENKYAMFSQSKVIVPVSKTDSASSDIVPAEPIKKIWEEKITFYKTYFEKVMPSIEAMPADYNQFYFLKLTHEQLQKESKEIVTAHKIHPDKQQSEKDKLAAQQTFQLLQQIRDRLIKRIEISIENNLCSKNEKEKEEEIVMLRKRARQKELLIAKIITCDAAKKLTEPERNRIFHDYLNSINQHYAPKQETNLKKLGKTKICL